MVDESLGDAAEVFEASVDGFGGAVAGVGVVEVGQDVCGSSFECPAQRDELWSGLVLWTGCFEGCWLLLVVLCPLARVLVG